MKRKNKKRRKKKKKTKSSNVVDSTPSKSDLGNPLKPADLFRRRARDLLTIGEVVDDSQSLWKKSTRALKKRKPKEGSRKEMGMDDGSFGIEMGILERRLAEHVGSSTDVAGASKFDDEDEASA